MPDATTQSAGGAEGTQEQSGTTQAQGQSPELAAALAEIEKAKAQIKSLSDEAAKYRNAKKQEAERATKAAESAGEYEGLYKQAQAKITEWEPLVQEATALRESLGSRVAERAKALPEAHRFALENISTLAARLAFLDKLEADENDRRARIYNWFSEQTHGCLVAPGTFSITYSLPTTINVARITSISCG